MTSVKSQVLANQVARVCTVGLGRELRQGAVVDQLLLVAEKLSDDPSLPPLRLFEEALVPSIERLGHGELGTLARLEFGLAPETRKLRFLARRREEACAELNVKQDTLERLEKAMHQAIAEDLLTRLALATRLRRDSQANGDATPHIRREPSLVEPDGTE
jgi:hypothetical protein